MSNPVQDSEIKLTSLSPGAGCGCKISPQDLAAILGASDAGLQFDRLLVGFEYKDDAAVFLWNDSADGNDDVVISTTDFFTPIVDDARLFGEIASVNALSDIYAMGGTPLLALGLLGWPTKDLGLERARAVISGAKAACARAGIPLAGGHSIDIPVPIFGLAVTGKGRRAHIKTNAGGRAGDLLFLTKPLGVGILTTAGKRGMVQPEVLALATRQMTQLNSVGAQLALLPTVHALTDVTGFGLLGHLLEICEASQLNARLETNSIPMLPNLERYIAAGCVPGGTRRNFASYRDRVGPCSELQSNILCDPQTSGGLLVTVDPAGVDAFAKVCRESGVVTEHLTCIGKLEHRTAAKERIYLDTV